RRAQRRPAAHRRARPGRLPGHAVRRRGRADPPPDGRDRRRRAASGGRGAVLMGLSFLKGLVASVNPCAFVLLPTYLAFFLGAESGRPGGQRSTVRRALVVSLAVRAGCMAVFVTIGLLSEFVTRWIEDHAKYFTLVLAIVFVAV